MPARDSRAKDNGGFTCSYPDGVQIARDLNDIGLMIGLGVGHVHEPSCIPYINLYEGKMVKGLAILSHKLWILKQNQNHKQTGRNVASVRMIQRKS